MKHYLAFDLGASSGRAILGTIDHGNVTLKELHRFENGPIAINGGLFWNLLGLFAELKAGLKAALREGVEISSIAIRHPLVVKCSPDPNAVAASIFKDSFVFGGGSLIWEP